MDSLLGLLMTAAYRLVRTASGAGLTVQGLDSRAVSLAATDQQVETLDSLQYELGEGPCLTAWRDRVAVRVDDVPTDRRWPRWSAAAALTPVRSSLSAPLVTGDTVVGAVKVYAEAPSSFSDEDEATLLVFAAQAAILVTQAQAFRRAGELDDQLRTLLRRRDDLNRACGVVMQREGVSAESAMTFLMSLADRDQRTVHDTAAQVLRRATRAPR
ncbi:GAF domain-containing protein [Cellulomonas sp. URHB0016]